MPLAQGGAQDLNVYSLDLQSADPAYLLLGYGYMPYFTNGAPQVSPLTTLLNALHETGIRTKALRVQY